MRRRSGELLAIALSFLILTGCSVGGREVLLETQMPDSVLFEMEGLSCSPEELRVYLANYRNLYGRIYDTDYWENTSDRDAFAANIKEAAFAHLTRVYALDLYAAGHDIALIDGESSACQEAAKKYFGELTKEEIAYTGAKQDTIGKMYSSYALAEKAYASIMETVNTEVSDDEARIMDAIVIYTADRGRAAEALKKASESSDFASVASTYSQLSYIDTSFGRGEYDEDVEAAVFSLDNGEHSNILETGGGYMIFYCVNKYNEELSEQKKLEIIEERRADALERIYSYYQDTATSVLNESLYEGIKPAEAPDIQTDSFFEVFDEYVGRGLEG